MLLVVVPLLVAIGGAFVWQSGGRYVSTENAYVKADIAQISPEVGGRVIEIGVRDHEAVKAGDLLMRIDPEPYRLALAKAEAALGPIAQRSSKPPARPGGKPNRNWARSNPTPPS